MRATKVPNAVHEANVAGLHQPTPAVKKPTPKDNKPTKEQIELAYDRALAAGDKQAMAALLDAYTLLTDGCC